MLYATELMGSAAYDAQGNYVGRVREFFIEPAEQPNRVSHFLISRGRFQPLVARYDQVAKVVPGRIDLNASERSLDAYQPNEAWLAVQKDLLDQQIIDTAGRKVVRVNDVDLAEFPTNAHVELRIAQVDVGVPGAVRRLLQGIAPSSLVRKLQSKLPQRSIRWEFVNLIEPDPLRRVKLRITHEKLEDLHPADLAEMMEELSAAERQGIIASLDEETAAAVLAELDERLTTQIVEKLDPEKAADIIEEMAPDAAADLLADLPKETSEELLEEMPNQEANDVRELLAFDPSTAGGMMNTEFAFVSESISRDEVLQWLRKQEFNLEQLDTIVILDKLGHFAGTAPIARIFLAAPEQHMSELKTEPLISISADANEKDVFEQFDKYNLRMLTVLDHDQRPIGVITVDDVVSRLVNA
ncbi:MAG TPA: CBS domain-containing protein [Candidatus Acidoferrales bacterium]|jgi:magnesium transporter|nr:CBS domain-containing protein [Candidatus Acidoferrales bacterium]